MLLTTNRYPRKKVKFTASPRTMTLSNATPLSYRLCQDPLAKMVYTYLRSPSVWIRGLYSTHITKIAVTPCISIIHVFWFLEMAKCCLMNCAQQRATSIACIMLTNSGYERAATPIRHRISNDLGWRALSLEIQEWPYKSNDEEASVHSYPLDEDRESQTPKKALV